MGTKFFVETNADGNLQYVRVKRADHHRRRHHRTADDDERLCRKHPNCMHAPLNEWNELVRNERCLRRDNRALKASLDGAMECAERERRRAAHLERECERIERDRDCLAVRLRDERQRCGARDDAFLWKERFERAAAIIEEKERIIEEQRNANAWQTRLLRRHGVAAGW